MKMTGRVSVRVETVEDLVKLTLSNIYQYSADKKFILGKQSSWKYVDEEAGKAWSALHEEIEEKYYHPGMYLEENKTLLAKYHEEMQKIDASKPEMVEVVYWDLTERTSGWYPQIITLGTELGEALDAVWTKRESRWAKVQERVGGLSLPGMLKRLGRTDVASRIEAKKLVIEEENKIRRIASVKAEIARQAKELKEYIEVRSGAELLGFDGNLSLNDIIALAEGTKAPVVDEVKAATEVIGKRGKGRPRKAAK